MGERSFTGCPCELVNPCKKSCSCASPFQSGGCSRCARYGNEEQRLAAAKRLVQQEIYAQVGGFVRNQVIPGKWNLLDSPLSFIGNCQRWVREADEFVQRITTCRKPLESPPYQETPP